MTSRSRIATTFGAVVIGSSSAGFSAGSLHAERTRQPLYANGHPTFTHASEDAAAPREEVRDPSALALREMRTYALQRYGVFEDDLQSTGSAHDWSPDWRLEWIDVRHELGTSRIYYVTHNRMPHWRYTSAWEEDVRIDASVVRGQPFFREPGISAPSAAAAVTNSLLRKLGGRDLPAVGGSIEIDRILALHDVQKRLAARAATADVLVVSLSPCSLWNVRRSRASCGARAWPRSST